MSLSVSDNEAGGDGLWPWPWPCSPAGRPGAEAAARPNGREARPGPVPAGVRNPFPAEGPHLPAGAVAAGRRLPAGVGSAGREVSGAARREGAGACAAPAEAAPSSARPSEEGRLAPGPAFSVLLGDLCPERGGRGLGRLRGRMSRPPRLSPSATASGLSPAAGQRNAARESGGSGLPTRWQHSRGAGRPVLPRWAPSKCPRSFMGTGLGSGRANSSSFPIQHLSGLVYFFLLNFL